MELLILGVLLWIVAHEFKRILPKQRAALGDKGKGLVAVGVLLSIVLMVLGYRAAPFVNLWYPPGWTLHVNNLLMLLAFYFMSPGPKKGAIFYRMRHPMQTGFALWAVSHLLVNGDLASVILFGGLGLWSVVMMGVINRAEPGWTPGPKGSIAKDAMFLVASAVLLVVVGYIHGMIGPWPFPG
ncbi:NnrU protein [Salinihabitans flavidus]|uniref:NnrU protein n=1 Tax=Salinihabitans flavidus TaxID=569882 RepID=A0A1H8VGP2_9RHOB|nr:NnrU family protein [Salinihabitans flavidus]SEP14500.1 NnrU protein [Salinihabitans flavidus]